MQKKYKFLFKEIQYNGIVAFLPVTMVLCSPVLSTTPPGLPVVMVLCSLCPLYYPPGLPIMMVLCSPVLSTTPLVYL